MRFHVLGICHTVSSKEYLSCAFTQKVVKFCSMMTKRTKKQQTKKRMMTMQELVKDREIHHVIHYGHERSDVEVDEHVTVMNDAVLKETYGDYDWKTNFFKHKAYDLAHKTFVANSLGEMYKRRLPGDLILCFWGFGHQDIAEPFKNECLIVEPGIGYPPETSFAQFKVYESYAVMHNHYGQRKVIHPPWHDCVIPNYFDPEDFEFRKEKENYILYLGRITRAKGVDVALHLAKKMGFRLVIAGQGSLETDMGEVNPPSNIEYVGFADVEKRKKLMAGAKALFITTYYIEPFGGVVVEAMMSGTPVITCDWGVFNELILHGITGYRCRTIDHFEWAIRNVHKINPQACRDWAVNNFSTERVRKMYEEYFDMLLKLKFSEGFTLEDPHEQNLIGCIKNIHLRTNSLRNNVL
jgi:glycosyltransferase involved in cell wall biosynthesis